MLRQSQVLWNMQPFFSSPRVKFRMPYIVQQLSHTRLSTLRSRLQPPSCLFTYGNPYFGGNRDVVGGFLCGPPVLLHMELGGCRTLTESASGERYHWGSPQQRGTGAAGRSSTARHATSSVRTGTGREGGEARQVCGGEATAEMTVPTSPCPPRLDFAWGQEESLPSRLQCLQSCDVLRKSRVDVLPVRPHFPC